MLSHRTTNSKQPESLPVEVAELSSRIAELPEEHRQHLESSLNRVVEMTRRRRRILNLVQEALSQLRLDMKYLMFDLHATRQERDALRNEYGEFDEHDCDDE